MYYLCGVILHYYTILLIVHELLTPQIKERNNMKINLEKVDYKYRGARENALTNITLSLEANKIYGLLGKNGVGKSTMLYLIAGLLKAKQGTISIDGIETQLRRPEILKDVFIVTEEFSLPNVSLSEYIKMNRPFYPNFSTDVLDNCLKAFELNSDMKLGELSLGQKKKVYMSFALATGTKILLFDEPTNGLDITSKSQFRQVVSQSMTEERTIIISTHQVYDIEQLVDHVVILSKKGVLLDMSTEEISQQYVFETRMPNDMDDVIYAEPSLQGNIVMAKRGNNPETNINLEMLFKAINIENQ